MRVRAIQPGYFEHIRRSEGDELNIPNEPKDEKTGLPKAFSKRWMEPVESEPKPALKAKETKAP